MSSEEILVERLREAGYAVQSTERAVGGAVAVAGLVTLQGGARLFAKTLIGPERDVFTVEAAGLRELRELGGVNTPRSAARLRSAARPRTIGASPRG